jgi:hypothetical protein
VKPFSILLLTISLLMILPFGLPSMATGSTPTQQLLQSSSLPYTWTLSRGPVTSYTLPVGPQYVAYTFYPNGTVRYNGFSVRTLSARWGSVLSNMTLPFTNLRYNSTVVEYVLNMTVAVNSLSLVVSYRQIPGTVNLLVSFSGTLSAAGILSQQFAGSGRKQLSGQALMWGAAGYDWSDSKAQSPSFNNVTSTVTWNTPASFKIDPFTLGTSAQSTANLYPSQRKIFVTSTGVIYVAWYDGSVENYASSADTGVTWSAPTVLTQCDGTQFSMWFDGTYVYQICGGTTANALCGATSNQVCWRTGTLTGSGTSITWNSWAVAAIGGNASGASAGSGGDSIASDTNGNIWITGQAFGNTGVINECACTGSSSVWTNATGFPQNLCTSPAGGPCFNPWTTLLPLTGGKMAIVFSGFGGNWNINATVWNGSSFTTDVWNADPEGQPASLTSIAASSVAVADDVWTAYLDSSGNIVSDVYHYASNSWDTAQTIVTSSLSTDAPYPTLSYDAATKTFYAFWLLRSTQTIYLATHGLTGASWSPAQSWITNINIPNSAANLQHEVITSYNLAPTANILQGRDLAPVVYEETHTSGGTTCTGNACDVRYQGLLVNVAPPGSQQPSSGTTAASLFQTTTVNLPLIGSVTLPAQLVSQNALLILLVFPAVLLISSMDRPGRPGLLSRKRKRDRRVSLV